MSRTLGAGLAGMLAGDADPRITMLRIDLLDGSTLALTDHDQVVPFDLGDGSVDYLPDTGILPSDLSFSAGFDPADFEVTGPVTEEGLTTLAALRGGRFDNATVRAFQINWEDPSQGAIKLLPAFVALAEVLGPRFKLTIRSDVARLHGAVGDMSGPNCRYTFGLNDGVRSFCPATPATLAATVSTVTDERAFSVTYSGTYANDYWNRGEVLFLTGDLAGTRRMEIFDFTSGGAGAGSLVLFAGLAAVPAVGDTMTIYQGCGHTRPDCVEILGDATDFGGEPDTPGGDQMLTYPSPQ
jgi:uncharacterized phage protein (TIGR02218 family)